MESCKSVTLFLLLCLAFSVCKARRLIPDPDADASPELAPDASSPKLAPDESPQLAPHASRRYRHKPIAVSRLSPKKGLNLDASSIYGPISSPAPSPWSDEFFDDMEGPEASAAMDDMEAKLNGPAANEAMDEAARYASEFDKNVLGPAASLTASAVKEGAAKLGPAVATAATTVKDKAAELAPTVTTAATTVRDKAFDLGPVATSAMDKVTSWFKGNTN